MKKLLATLLFCVVLALLAACDTSAPVASTPQPAATATALANPTALPTNSAVPATATTVDQPSVEQPSPTAESTLAPTAEPITEVFTAEPTTEPSVAPTTQAAATTQPDETGTAGRPTASVGIDYPAEGAQVTFPVHVQARLGKGVTSASLKLTFANGLELTDDYTPLLDQNGNSWLVDSLDYLGEGAPPAWKSGPVTLQVLTSSGKVLASRKLNFLNGGDPGTMQIKLYWAFPDQDPQTLQEVTRWIPRTKQVGTASLNELLWGIGPRNFAGFVSAVPSPEEVFRVYGGPPKYAPRVTLLKLTIVNGVATAVFSKEMHAYGGGSSRVGGLRAQLFRTLKQFPTVKEVHLIEEGTSEEESFQP